MIGGLIKGQQDQGRCWLLRCNEWNGNAALSTRPATAYQSGLPGDQCGEQARKRARLQGPGISGPNCETVSQNLGRFCSRWTRCFARLRVALLQTAIMHSGNHVRGRQRRQRNPPGFFLFRFL